MSFYNTFKILFISESHIHAVAPRPPSLNSVPFLSPPLGERGGFSSDEATASQIPRAGIEFGLRVIRVTQSSEFLWLWDHLTASIFSSPSFKNSPHQGYNADPQQLRQRNRDCNIETPFICINPPPDSCNLAADAWMLPGSRYTSNVLSPRALEST